MFNAPEGDISSVLTQHHRLTTGQTKLAVTVCRSISSSSSPGDCKRLAVCHCDLLVTTACFTYGCLIFNLFITLKIEILNQRGMEKSAHKENYLYLISFITDAVI